MQAPTVAREWANIVRDIGFPCVAAAIMLYAWVWRIPADIHALVRAHEQVQEHQQRQLDRIESMLLEIIKR